MRQILRSHNFEVDHSKELKKIWYFESLNHVERDRGNPKITFKNSLFYSNEELVKIYIFFLFITYMDNTVCISISLGFT